MTYLVERAILADISHHVFQLGEDSVETAKLILTLIDEGYVKRTWHGPNLKQSIRGVTARQAAWRPEAGRHNIWELTLHAAYW